MRWLNRTVLGIGLASLFSDWAHETATTLLPAYLASMGAAALWVGLIEGIADGLSSAAKMGSGYYTDRLQRRKPVAVFGYLVTALGTASLGLATAPWHVLLSRSVAWLGRGLRTPVRKALLAAAVTRETYGRAFGFERMMDTLGAILGPASAVILFPLLHHSYSKLFALTLIPGVFAAGLIALVVREKSRAPIPHISFGQRLRLLPHSYRQFLLAAGLFGAGDFAHTLLILLAAQKLTPQFGAPKAATIAAGLYLLHNAFYALFAPVGGWLADRVNKRNVLAGGYFLAVIMAVLLVALPARAWMLAAVFAVGGIYVAVVETLEDSFCAELVEEKQHGMAFGVLATVNGIGDFLSSVIVGLLWSEIGASAAFAYSGILFPPAECLPGVLGTGKFEFTMLIKKLTSPPRVKDLATHPLERPDVASHDPVAPRTGNGANKRIAQWQRGSHAGGHFSPSRCRALIKIQNAVCPCQVGCELLNAFVVRVPWP
jgi:MFS family permease